MTKPYQPRILLHRVASIINLRENAAMINLFQNDWLKGLHSKEYFYQCIKEILRQNPDKKYDIICSDIENFKLVNDVFGISAGDRLLCDIAELYKTFISGKGICGRFNADLFVCLIEHKYEYVDEMFINACEQMCDRARLAAQSIKGYYAKYFAKYDDELRSRLLKEKSITEIMESALAEEQFEIYLQAKYQIKDNVLYGAVALVRWNHPQWGVQSPGEFIPLVEKNGFITKVD